jgi:DNA-binding transcriptional ArsR family regulator
MSDGSRSPRPVGSGRARSARVFAALGDRRRLHLLERLTADGPLSITRLSEGAGVSRQAVAKHLAVLSDAGLVHDEKRGRERLYEVDPESVQHVRHALDRISAKWDRAVERLRGHVER